tara:strand:+ start:8411 stop:8629 length:219 start_codon:yes stop_codon:yes gene_type:complete
MVRRIVARNQFQSDLRVSLPKPREACSKPAVEKPWVSNQNQPPIVTLFPDGATDGQIHAVERSGQAFGEFAT